MTLVDRNLDSHTDGVAVSRRLEDLSAILQRDCAIAVWHRTPQRSFQNWLNHLEVARFPQGRLILRVAAISDAVDQLCEIAGLPQSPHRDLLINDIAVLGEVFADLVGSEFLRLRLERVDDDACRKFHRDKLTIRLVCTYRGPGTEYGRSNGNGVPARIFETPTFSPILLRGSLWPEESNLGLVHRSPPIEGTGLTRFVLVLDPENEGKNDSLVV